MPVSHGATADVVIGQSSMTTASYSVTATGIRNPNKVDYFNNKLYITDINNGRILIYNSIPSTNGAAADDVVGKSSLTATTPTTGLNGLNSPFGFLVTNDYFWVNDTSNLKIKRFTMPVLTGSSATTYVGGFETTANSPNVRTTSATTATQLTTPLQSLIVNNKLIVSDYHSNRVLIWNSLPTTSNTPADVVLGQLDMTTTTANNTLITNAAARLNRPFGLYSDGTKLYIADYGNNRVLVFNSIPTTNAAAASLVLGQANSSTVTANRGGSPSLATLSGPTRVFGNTDRLYVADSSNHRVLMWTSLPTTNGASANYVIGQSTVSAYTSGVGQNRLNNPQYVEEYNGKLVIADTSNHRVLVWNSLPTAHGANADVVVGQSSFTSLASGLTGSGLNAPRSARIINGKLWVADQQNQRFIVWNQIPTSSGSSADHILGQNGTTKSYENFGGASGISFYFPYDIISDGQYYWITDSANHRVIKVQIPF